MSARKNILMADDAYKAGAPCDSRDIPGCFVVARIAVMTTVNGKREALANATDRDGAGDRRQRYLARRLALARPMPRRQPEPSSRNPGCRSRVASERQPAKARRAQDPAMLVQA